MTDESSAMGQPPAIALVRRAEPPVGRKNLKHAPQICRSAAVLLVALQQSVASYGYAQTDDASETLPEIRAELTVTRQADISDQIHDQIHTVISDLNADNSARLEEQVRRLAGETLAAAAPILSEQILALTERTIADLKADNRARLEDQARRSPNVAVTRHGFYKNLLFPAGGILTRIFERTLIHKVDNKFFFYTLLKIKPASLFSEKMLI